MSFGYKKKTSCKHAFYCVNEVINFYRQGKSKIHLVSIDASKAFDKLWRDGLFFKLIGKIPNELWRILHIYYGNSRAMVKYDGLTSHVFNISEGVKQGGVVSSYLFNFFINDLIENCVNLDIGAKINRLNLSIIAYCDDVMILSPSVGQAIKLLNECFSYSIQWKIEFNPKKSMAITIGKTRYIWMNDLKLMVQ